MAQTKVQLLQPDLGDVIDFDASTLFVDGADNRIGIRNTNPQYELDVTGTINATNFRGNISVGTVDDWIVHTGDTDTKIGFPAVDKFQVFAGGGPRLTAISTGLGIGTDSPDHNLHVYQSAGDAVVTIESTGNGNDSALEFIRTSSGGDGKGGGSIYVTGDTSASEARMHFGVGHNINHGTDPKMTIMGNGEVGIGTDNPTQPLHISRSSSGQAEFGMRLSYENTAGGGTTTNAAVYVTATGLKFKNHNSSRHFYFETGNVAIGGTAVPTGTLELSRTNSTDMLTLRELGNNVVFAKLGYNSASGVSILDVRSEGHMRFLTGGNNERLRIISSTGEVNIGANLTQTTYPFSVQKDLNNGGNLAYFANADSTYNQGLTLSFDSNKDIEWSGGSGAGGMDWNMGTRGYKWRVGGNDRALLSQYATLTLESGSQGANSKPGIELKSSGYTGNITRLFQDSPNAQSVLETTERSLVLDIDSGDQVAGTVFRVDIDGGERFRISTGGGTNIWNSIGYYAGNLTECNSNNIALNIRQTRGGHTKGIALGAIGSATLTSIQAYDSSNNSANNLILNPFGGDVVVGGTSVGGAASFGMQASGHVRSILASGTAGDTLFGAISGVSNGFQINTAANNHQIYTFHNGSAIGLRITADGKVGLGVDPSYSFHQIRSGAVEWVIGSSTAGSAALVFDGDANGDASGGDYSHIRHTTDGNMEYAARNGSGNAAHHMFKTNTTEQFRIHDDGIMGQPFGPCQHNGGSVSAIVNTTGRFKVGGNQFQTNYKQNTGTGWYTIAINSGGRSIGRIGIRETYSSRHQACVFYAAHHYGGSSNQNCINTIFSSGRHSGNPIGAIRIKAYGTYDGALLQVYLRDASHGVTAYLLGDNMQDQGWVMKDWIADGTDPGGMSNWSAINSNGGVAAYSDMNEIQAGGASFDGHIIPGRDDVTDLGTPSYRFDDIFATNTTVQGSSDERLKQDIASLTTAEMNAAKRMSALFKTYRWKSRVSEKGDKARTHTGVIAQQVKAALEAEGLDPTKYGFYGFNEWYEHADGTKLPLETATREGDSVEEGTNATLGGNIVVPAGFEKKNVYSIRIGELLAFIAAYNDQRFTSIESRLTALES